MALVMDETFAGGIPASFATMRSQGGSASAFYNGAAQAVDLSNSTFGGNIWDIDAISRSVKGEVEIDIELVSDLANVQHAGVWLTAGSPSDTTGVRFAHANATWFLSKFDGSTPFAGEGPQSTAVEGGSQSFNVGDRRVFNLRWDMGATGGANTIECRVDGVLKLSSSYLYAALRPAVFFYTNTIRFHSIRSWDDFQAPPVVTTVRAFSPSEISLSFDVRAPGAGGAPVTRTLENLIASRNTFQGGNGKVVGTVKIKGTPNAPVQRKVRLFDDFTGLLVQETFSDPITGAYAFVYVDQHRKYTVISYDHTNTFRAVLADNIVPDYLA